MKDAQFNGWIQDWVPTQKTLDHIINNCQKSETPVTKVSSIWNDVPLAVKTYQQLAGGRTEDIDLASYIHTLSLKNINFSESHTTEDAQEIASYVDASDEASSEIQSEV